MKVNDKIAGPRVRSSSGSERRQQYQRDEMRFFAIAEVAELVGVSTRTVRRWIKHKKLVAHYFGAAVRIAESDLNGFIALHRAI